MIVLLCKILISADFYVEPKIFSPKESLGKKDKAQISGNMEQTLPVNVNIYRQNHQDIIRTIPYTEFNYNYGDITNRSEWDGKDNLGNFVPDGFYEFKFITFIEHKWSKGNFHRDFRGMFISPYDVAIRPDGRIYVLDSERIQVFDSNRNYLFSIQPEWTEPGYLGYATSISIYQNKLYVMVCGYYGNKIKIFDINGNFIKEFGDTGSEDGKFNFDWRNNIAIDSNGRIWVVDSGNSRIQVFDSNGNFLFKFGTAGTGNGQFSFTYVVGNIAIDSNNNVYITDSGNGPGRIQVFNSQGVYQRTIYSAYEGGPVQLTGISGPIAICGAQNRIYVSSFNNNKIVILNNDGTYFSQIGKIASNGMTAFQGRGPGEFSFLSKIRGTSTNLYTVECYDNYRLQIFNTDGTYISQIGMTEGEFLEPRGLAIGPTGNIYVCDYGNARIQIFNQSGIYQLQILIPYLDYSSGIGYGLLKPEYITVDTDGKIYVCGHNGVLLLVIDSSGNLISIVLKDAENKYIIPRGIAIVGDYIYVLGHYFYQKNVRKIFVFNKKTGVFHNSFGAFDYDADTGYITVYQNQLYVLDKNGISVFNSNGTLVKTLSQVVTGIALAIDNTGKIYVTGSFKPPYYGISVYDINGNYLYSFGEADYFSDLYSSPSGITFDSQLNVYFSDVENHRIHKYSTTSNFLLDTFLSEIDNTKPNASISYPPRTPLNITSNFQMKGTASDIHFESYKVELHKNYYPNPTLIYTGTSSVSDGILSDINISSLSEGTHTLSLFVSDLAGNTNSDSVTFYIDRTPPSSYVNQLNQYMTTTSFTVSWTGQDTGSGIACYDIQYRDGLNHIWTDWLIETTKTSDVFNGQDGHTYYFRCRAKDKGENWENYPSDYDTYTMVDTGKPVVNKVIPANNSYVGANPTIKIEIFDPMPGSGIKSSSITVKLDGNNQSFTFSDNTITIKPTLTKGQHTFVINFSDFAGNQADTLTLNYNALIFQGSVVNLDPNPNPSVSEVMIGGEIHRYYKVVDQNNNPASGVTLKIQWSGGSITTDGSDENGIVDCVLKSTELGSVNQIITCSIVEVGGNTISQPISFNVKILPRISASEFRFGSGINLKAAIGVGGKIGTKKGMIYRIDNTDLNSKTDDKIEIERSFEGEAGIAAEASVGGGVEGSCYASADAGGSESLVIMRTNTYLFDNPYFSDQQQILRSGLVISSLLEGIGGSISPIVSDMLGFIIDAGYNSVYPEYKQKETLSAGLRVEGNASAGTGFGIGDKENVLLGIGVGAGIEGEAEILGNLLSSFEYKNNKLNTTEIGAGISFASEFSIFGGLQGNIINDKIKIGIGGEETGKYVLTIFAQPNGTINRAELKISGKSEWGIEHPNFGPGSTKTITIKLTGDQISAIMNDLNDIMGLNNILKGISSNITLGSEEIKSRFSTLVTKLKDYVLQKNLPIAYCIEEEIGDSFSFSPSIKVALGAEIEAGIALDLEKVVTYVIEEGIINKSGLDLKVFPLTKYQKDNYVPSFENLEFATVFDDCVNGIITAMTNFGKLAVEVVEKIGDTVISAVHWVSSKVSEYIPFLQFKQISGGLEEVFSFTPEGLSISHLSSQINSQTIINNGLSTLSINPNSKNGILTIHYDDSILTPKNESKLIIYQWDKINRRWIGLKDSQVDINSNKVSVEIEKLGTFRLGLPLPYGEIILNVEPPDVDKNTPSQITVTSEPILLVTGEPVSDGTLITVRTQDKFTSEVKDYGTILTEDADLSIDGIQIATSGGKIKFVIVPPSNPGSGIIIVNSVFGNATGKAYFNVVDVLDSDGNNLPDHWEKFYFGNIGQNINSDPDKDGLINLQEYYSRTNPLKFDTDEDGIPDGWEVNNRLNPQFDDSYFDPDYDGYSNLIEYQSGTDPHNSNSFPGKKGDLNNDGMTDIFDVILCLRQALGLDQQTISADLNNDNSVDISDVILILRKSLGLN
ncbi:MAG: 6-bladed beta-propeller [Candidatus Omnitrophica bacterium]|nr:6-bladed beta-propeller [Candidatus Omnitrophota bacterium]